MTAKETKISSMARQQRFIQKQLDVISVIPDGNAGYPYKGDIYAEVLKHFSDDGWEINRCTPRQDGTPVYYFSCADVNLTPEEYEEAISKPYDEDSDDGDTKMMLNGLLGALNGLSGLPGMFDYDDDF